MSELRTLSIVAILISLVVGLTSMFVFHIPFIYSFIIMLATGVVFFFIVLWSSYLFIFK